MKNPTYFKSELDHDRILFRVDSIESMTEVDVIADKNGDIKGTIYIDLDSGKKLTISSYNVKNLRAEYDKIYELLMTRVGSMHKLER